MKDDCYTIYEYNSETNKYLMLCDIKAPDAKSAKQEFIKRTGWEKRRDTLLFAKIPICR